nr:ROK family transcriptional regulator [Microbacterium hominis]
MSGSDVQRTAPETAALAGRSFSAGRALRHAAKVLPEHARAHNRSLVLQTLFHQGAMSRADLSRETGLTRVTISDLVAELIDDGYVAERGLREVTGPGKPAILVDLDREGHRIVGLDLSGTDRFLGAVLTLDGEIVARLDVDVPADPADILAVVIDLARRLVADAHAPVLGIGVGSPGIVDDRGVVLTAPNLGWHDVDLEGVLRAELGLPVLVANDANAAVLAEYTFGGAADDVLLVRVGRGVGSGLLAGGQPMRGSRFAAGEIGHISVDPAARAASAARSAASSRGCRCPPSRCGSRSPTRTATRYSATPVRVSASHSPPSWACSTCRRSCSPASQNFSTDPSRPRPSRHCAPGRSPSSTTACRCG